MPGLTRDFLYRKSGTTADFPRRKFQEVTV